MKKRVIALLLAAACCAALLAGCGEGGTQMEEGNLSYIIPDMSGAQMELYIPTNSDFEIEGSYANITQEKHLNMDLCVVEGNVAAMTREKIAQGEVPDLIWTNGYNHDAWSWFVDEQGLFVNVLECLDLMPNLKAYLQDPANKEMVDKFTYEEGKMYAVPTWKTGSAEIYAYLYRKDIFDKHGLTFPTNQEEFVTVLRKLKELYPESEPFAMRSMKKNIQAAQHYGHLWGASHLTLNSGVAFTLDADGNYYLAQTSRAYQEMAEFWHGLMAEGLMNKKSTTMATDGWYGYFRENTSFITYDKVDRLPLMNKNGQMDNPDFLVVAGAPFNMGSYAQETDVVATSFAEDVTSNAFLIGYGENMGDVLAYVDWLYSAEGQLLTNWGVEGESYEVAEDGTKYFKEGFLESVGGWAASGLGASGAYGIMDFSAYKAACEPYLAQSITLAEQFAGKSPKQPILSFTKDEATVYRTWATGMYNYVCGEWYKFVSGERDLAQWDQVLERVKKHYGYDELIKIHQDAYRRLQQGE